MMTHLFRNLALSLILLLCLKGPCRTQPSYAGNWFTGEGDTTYLHLLDQAYRMTRPDPVLENLSMLYLWDLELIHMQVRYSHPIF